jgi:hypothetical protein
LGGGKQLRTGECTEYVVLSTQYDVRATATTTDRVLELHFWTTDADAATTATAVFTAATDAAAIDKSIQHL